MRCIKNNIELYEEKIRKFNLVMNKLRSFYDKYSADIYTRLDNTMVKGGRVNPSEFGIVNHYEQVFFQNLVTAKDKLLQEIEALRFALEGDE